MFYKPYLPLTYQSAQDSGSGFAPQDSEKWVCSNLNFNMFVWLQFCCHLIKYQFKVTLRQAGLSVESRMKLIVGCVNLTYLLNMLSWRIFHLGCLRQISFHTQTSHLSIVPVWDPELKANRLGAKSWRSLPLHPENMHNILLLHLDTANPFSE